MPDGSSTDERLRQLLSLGRSLVSELDLDAVLTRIAQAAADLTGARYAALGVLGPDRQDLERFITVGLEEPQRRAIGDLPRGRGVLGVLIRDPRPLRLQDVGSHPESYGFGAGHPPMRIFLGVPIRMAEGEVFGNLYLTDKQGATAFDEDDEELVMSLAEWAAVAIGNARRFGGVSGRRNELERTVRAFEITNEISRALAGETELDRIVELIVKRSRAVVEARATMLALVDGSDLVIHATAGDEVFAVAGARVPIAGSLAGDVLESGRSRRFGEVPSTGTMGAGVAVRSALMAPLRFRGRDLGVLAAFDRIGDGPFDPDDERLLAAFAVSAAPAVVTALDVAGERLRRSIEAAERERTRWARELHDQTLQDLAAVKTLLSAARRTGDLERLDGAVETAIEQLQLGITSLRSLITDLRPASLDELGLEAALRALGARTTQTTDLDVSIHAELRFEAGHVPTRLEADLEATAYRIVQEAITNAVKHADARTIRVDVHEHAEHLELVVADDGRGFDPAAVTRGFGLTGMEERAGLVGGTVRLAPRPEGGTVVSVELPVQRAAQPPAAFGSAAQTG